MLIQGLNHQRDRVMGDEFVRVRHHFYGPVNAKNNDCSQHGTPDKFGGCLHFGYQYWFSFHEK
jgi:hypothetical protein